MREMPVQQVHVVFSSGWEGTTFIGAFSTNAAAHRARKAANATYQRTPGTMGSFRVVALIIDAQIAKP